MATELKIAAIIQARMSSSRLPGKIMLDLAGKPVLWHVFHRLKKSRRINQIILATTTDSEDDVLADYARANGVDVVRGSRDNVLSRFAMAVDQYDPDYIVRVTSDCPTLDPKIIDRLIDVLIEEQGDYCGWNPPATTLHGGFEPVSRRLFQRIVDEGADHPVAQEHVIGYLSVNPDIGTFVGTPAPSNHVFERARMWLDTPVDLEFLRTIYARTGAEPGEIEIDDVATLLRNDPSISAINAHVHQKQADEVSRKVIIRCDGDADIGLGHISRMMSLATQLRERFAIAVTFALMHGSQGAAAIEAVPFPCVLAPKGIDEVAWLDVLIKDKNANAVVFDIRTNLPGSAIDQWRERGVLCVLFDDIGPRLDHADMAFCPPTPATLPLHGRAGRPDIRAGWEWLILGEAFNDKKIVRQKHDHSRILISCGASDPAGYTLMALKALDDVPQTLYIDVIAGPLYANHAALNQAAEQSCHKVTILEAPSDMASLMASADIGIVSFGVTAAEMAAMGLPALYLCLSPDHAQSATVYDQANLGVNLGVFTPDDHKQLSEALRDLLNDPIALKAMSDNAMNVVDGRGAVRIAKVIAERLHASHPHNQL